MRFRLRTLLIVLAIGPPIIAGIFSFHYQNWRAFKALRSLEQVQVKRDQLLEDWRVAFDRVGTDQTSANQEAAIREQHYAAFRDFKNAKAPIEAKYGSMEAARKMGAQAQIFER